MVNGHGIAHGGYVFLFALGHARVLWQWIALGVILIGVEVFVLPGFGFPAIAGIFLIIFSMVLVTLDNIPQTSDDWVNVGGRITTLGLGIVFALIGAFVVAYYLPSIPYANRLVLKPPDEAEFDAESRSFGPTFAHLLGAIGVAATTLRPAGKGRGVAAGTVLERA